MAFARKHPRKVLTKNPSITFLLNNVKKLVRIYKNTKSCLIIARQLQQNDNNFLRHIRSKKFDM
ncbi:hypothetical protein EDD69_11069 [Thermolongibacillus altinsuensis]|uniref:Uncharacterized protein n=1 Tax=Thermolongibacillus altinsuensis TaxID=575256 RepID=A0A4R1QDP3_9BACL|nr:hypothetical protein EDD69_11069 [Thermolongibacillus altinsuensis]